MNGREWQSPLRVRGVERPGLFEPLSHAASGGQAMDDSLSYVMLGSGESAGRGHVFSRKARTFTPRFRERTVTFYQTGSRGRGVIGISKRTDAVADGSRGGRVSLRGTVVSRVVV